jgi:hypothetical protein
MRRVPTRKDTMRRAPPDEEGPDEEGTRRTESHPTSPAPPRRFTTRWEVNWFWNGEKITLLTTHKPYCITFYHRLRSTLPLVLR